MKQNEKPNEELFRVPRQPRMVECAKRRGRERVQNDSTFQSGETQPK